MNPPQNRKCCNDPHWHNGRIWGIWFLPVTCCCHCDEVEAKFGWFGEMALFVADFFNDSEEFTIEIDGQEKNTSVK